MRLPPTLPLAPRFESPIEAELYHAFESIGIPPTTQFSIGVFRVDMAFPDSKLIVECDGHSFHTGEYNWERDRYRQKRIEKKGWKFERFQGWLIRRYPIACAGKVALKYFPDKVTPYMKERIEANMELLLARTGNYPRITID